MNILRQSAAILAVALVFVGQAAAVDHSAYGQLLGKYVTDDGVDYRAWHRQQADQLALADVLADYGQIRSSDLAADERKALLINLYNAAMIQAVLEHYPIDSVTEIGLIPHSVFKKRWIDFDGAKVSLDDIEKGTLLKDYPDARVHFAVNCASVSCPPLRTEPFVGSRLDAQLDEQTRQFAASPVAAKVDDRGRRTAFSKLFKWYKGDFDVDDPAEYLNRYRSTPLPTGYKVDWQPYDWSLNQSSN
jgi:hypothetical protein